MYDYVCNENGDVSSLFRFLFIDYNNNLHRIIQNNLFCIVLLLTKTYGRNELTPITIITYAYLF